LKGHGKGGFYTWKWNRKLQGFCKFAIRRGVLGTKWFPSCSAVWYPLFVVAHVGTSDD